MRVDRCSRRLHHRITARRASPFRRLPAGFTCTCHVLSLSHRGQIISCCTLPEFAHINIIKMAKRNLLLSVDDSEVRTYILDWMI